jgi:hypothetical protein
VRVEGEAARIQTGREDGPTAEAAWKAFPIQGGARL